MAFSLRAPLFSPGPDHQRPPDVTTAPDALVTVPLPAPLRSRPVASPSPAVPVLVARRRERLHRQLLVAVRPYDSALRRRFVPRMGGGGPPSTLQRQGSGLQKNPVVSSIFGVYAVFASLRHWQALLRLRRLLIHSDSSTVVWIFTSGDEPLVVSPSLDPGPLRPCRPNSSPDSGKTHPGGQERPRGLPVETSEGFTHRVAAPS